MRRVVCGSKNTALSRLKANGVVLADPHVGVGAHARRHLLAAELGDDEGVRAGRLDDLDLGVEHRDGLRVAVDALAVGHRLRADAEDHLAALARACSASALGGAGSDDRLPGPLRSSTIAARPFARAPCLRSGSSPASP